MNPPDLARKLFGNTEFQALPYNEKIAKFEQVANSPLVITSGIRRDDLIQIFNEETGGSGFQKLTRDPMYILLTKTDPRDITNLCRVNPLVARLCQDDNTFRNLLILHYPDSFDEKNIPYKEQYRRLTYGGKVLTFGHGNSGQLGLGDRQDVMVPTMIPEFKYIDQVACGSNHTALLDFRGRVWTFGSGAYGQLGLDDDIDEYIPTMIPGLEEKIVQVSCGGAHTALLDSQGRVWTFGQGDYGQLGLDDDEARTIPTLISELPRIKQISCGKKHTAVVDIHGQVWTFGYGEFGQLGLDDDVDEYIPTMIPGLEEEIVQVSCGGTHTALLDSQGRVWTFGQGDFGQLGLGNNQDVAIPTMIPGLANIEQISCGYAHTACLDIQGKAWTFGYGEYGRLGLGDNRTRNTPIVIPGFEGIKQISCGGDHTVILDTQSRVWAFGSGGYGQLGLGYVGFRSTPTMIPGLENIIQVSCGGNHTVVLKKNN